MVMSSTSQSSSSIDGKNERQVLQEEFQTPEKLEGIPFKDLQQSTHVESPQKLKSNGSSPGVLHVGNVEFEDVTPKERPIRQSLAELEVAHRGLDLRWQALNKEEHRLKQSTLENIQSEVQQQWKQVQASTLSLRSFSDHAVRSGLRVSRGVIEVPQPGSKVTVKDTARPTIFDRLYLDSRFNKIDDVATGKVMSQMSGYASHRHGVRVYFHAAGKHGFVALEELIGFHEIGVIEAHAAGYCEGNCKFVARWGDNSTSIVDMTNMDRHGGGDRGDEDLRCERARAETQRKLHVLQFQLERDQQKQRLLEQRLSDMRRERDKALDEVCKQKHAVLNEMSSWKILQQKHEAEQRQLRLQMQQAAAVAREPIFTRVASLKSRSASTWCGLHDLVQVSWVAKFGETVIPLKDLQRAVDKEPTPRIVRLHKQTFLLSPESLCRSVCSPSSISRYDLFQASLGLNETLELEPQLQQLAEDLRKPRPETPKLKQMLLPYQSAGVAWINANLSNGFGCLLCDSMGLGKTMQSLAVIQILKARGELHSAAAVVAPKSLLSVWEAEIISKTFLVSTRFADISGEELEQAPAKRVRMTCKQSERRRGWDLILMTYDQVLHHCDRLSRMEFSMLILDEIQSVKNPATQRWQALQRVIQDTSTEGRSSIPRLLGLSGTPIENRLADLWSIFQLVLPGYLGSSLKAFQSSGLPEDTDRLRRLVAPFMLRRNREDPGIAQVIAGASQVQKRTKKVDCHLSMEQAAIYRQVQEASQSIIEATSHMQRRGQVFKLLNDLTKICNHPRLYQDDMPLDGALSGKAACLLQILKGVLQAHEKALVFTRFHATQALLKKLIEQQLPTSVLTFNGSMSESQRVEVCESFKKPSFGVLILTIGVGSLGLNLTEANHVFHYDRWWNPARERQAEDRCYRIGQVKDVHVAKLISVGTFEERVDELLKGKEALARDVLDDVEPVHLTDLDDQGLAELFALRPGTAETDAE